MSRTHKIGNGKYDLHPFWFRFSGAWGRSGGRFWKRLLSKSRRKAAKEFINEQLAEYQYKMKLRSLPGIEGECNWKGW